MKKPINKETTPETKKSWKSRVLIRRAYDYCNFEVELGTDEPLNPEQINEMRKEAATLVDTSIRQYRLAKHFEAQLDTYKTALAKLLSRAPNINGVVEYSPEEQAIVDAADFIKSLPTFNYSTEDRFKLPSRPDPIQAFLD